MSWLLVAALVGAGAPDASWLGDPARPVSARLEAVSAKFLGTRYLVSPLGEGKGKDADPLIRTDAVDCLTFVETTIALSLAPSTDAVLPLLTKIRYGGDTVAFEERNHVMEAQWLPSNLSKGFLKDVTRELGGEATVKVTKTLDDAAWAGKAGADLGLGLPAQKRGEFSWEIIPASAAEAKLAQAPTGTIVIVVRADRPALVTRISHVGFLVHKKAGPFLRHASKSFGKVVDEPLANYLGRNLGYAKWTVEGLSLFSVVAPR